VLKRIGKRKHTEEPLEMALDLLLSEIKCFKKTHV